MAIQIDPRGLTFMQWAARVIEQEHSIPLPMGERYWRPWARAVVQVIGSVPDPDSFAIWEDWALAWLRSE